MRIAAKNKCQPCTACPFFNVERTTADDCAPRFITRYGYNCHEWTLFA